MHEMSIVEALLETLEREMRAHPGARVRIVHMSVGRLRQLEPELLQLCYEAAVRGTVLEGSRLEIQRVDASARCDDCGAMFGVEDNFFECPNCHSARAHLLAGNNLELTTIEMQPAHSSATAA